MNIMKHQVSANSPITKPNACGFLWNEKMMISMNCQGYANAQFMQPEPSKYAFSPSLEAKTFMQPEHPYFAHHPGRFFYIKNEKTNALFSLPFAPCKILPESFSFIVESDLITWKVKNAGIEIELCLSLADDRALEKWSVKIKKSQASADDNWSIYAYFPLGYMSWMNQSADFDLKQQAVVGTYVTPYQKLDEYPSLKNTAQKTFLCADRSCTSWCASQNAFEGLGGLRQPDAVLSEQLPFASAIYETPCASLQHRICLRHDAQEQIQYLFGPIYQNQDIALIKQQYFTTENNDAAKQTLAIEKGFGSIRLTSPDQAFDDFVNHWLPRQVQYHYEVNRLTTDPQTRNYIQDNIGACFIQPSMAKKCLLTSLSQQHFSGEMPDGILLHPDAELKYINQIPHSDHCVWLPLLLQVYLNQTNDTDLLSEMVGFQDSDEQASVFEHIEKALLYLLKRRDYRGLCFIDQGDWCDPMNMVGAKGKGVSAWLTMASSYAIQVWQTILVEYSSVSSDISWSTHITDLNKAINEHCWDKEWFARGITDDGALFGVSTEEEGRIYLNPQSWSLLCKAAGTEQQQLLKKSVTKHLQTPYGNMMLAPSYTHMHEHIGRLTQKHIGCAENGSVYNHAFVFWIFSLFESGNAEQGFLCVDEMIKACQSDASGQLPVYVPNYFRGAFFQAPEVAGKSSHLFNTGTAAWLYRIVIEKICGLQGKQNNLIINPNLPSAWGSLYLDYKFRDATISLSIEKTANNESEMRVNGVLQNDFVLQDIEMGKHYEVSLSLPVDKPKVLPVLTIIMGVSGSGKTSLAESISQCNDAMFIEGDDLHSAKSKQKMANGIPLDDTDREPWIERIVLCVKQKLLHGYDVVLSFSGLKQVHRHYLISALSKHTSVIHPLFLDTDFNTIEKRIAQRSGHFFDPSLLKSQFEALEMPNDDEATILSASRSIDELTNEALKCLNFIAEPTSE
ncbi:gluconokinase, GntK/IdnK-type [Glaciecola sp. KUL10]|uniref:gluconokinase, GntK/IdnK-type n=1 Tax=Glaciecola sp. (strain KUL10) TaxID=2161813 RepID=UPI000D78759B|nr:gluconokinase, GntK/IdnK-type [Glaciecola sp. KUL10]GBL05393.1 NdvB protein [Glaciecola sp. KUL10]